MAWAGARLSPRHPQPSNKSVLLERGAWGPSGLKGLWVPQDSEGSKLAHVQKLPGGNEALGGSKHPGKSLEGTFGKSGASWCRPPWMEMGANKAPQVQSASPEAKAAGQSGEDPRRGDLPF